MKIIKLTTAWKHSFLKNQINPNIVGYKFEIDNNCSDCDYWIIWGDLPPETTKATVNCPTQNIFYMTDEVHEKKTFIQKFLNQFANIITCRDDLYHPNIIRTHEINHWHINKSFTDLYHLKDIIKTKNLSVVCSDLTLLIGHKKRYAFVNKLIGHFKDRIDVFGRGFNSIDDKWDALAPYKYSIAIENSAVNGYFTEKLTECYLSQTFPIYYGAPDIENYFSSSALLTINIDDYKASIKSIEDLLENDPWEKVQDILNEQKINFLNKYHLFPALCKVIENQPLNNQLKTRNTIYGHETFYDYYKIRKFWSTYKHFIYK
jgi:hypothetical protein